MKSVSCVGYLLLNINMIATYVFERERFADYFNLITLPFGGNEENHENYGYDNRFPGPELNPEPPRLQNKCL